MTDSIRTETIRIRPWEDPVIEMLGVLPNLDLVRLRGLKILQAERKTGGSGDVAPNGAPAVWPGNSW